MTNNGNNRTGWRFWKTLPGVLAGIAAIIAAVGGALSVFFSRPSELERNDATETKTQESVSTTEDCITTTKLSNSLDFQDLPCLQPAVVYRDGKRQTINTWPLRQPRSSDAQATWDLQNNTPPKQLVRFVPLAPEAVDRLGPSSKVSYIYASDYSELKGLSIADAIRKIGLEPTGNYSIIIFEVKENGFRSIPASYRGFVKIALSLNREEGRNYPIPADKDLRADLFDNHGDTFYKWAHWRLLCEKYRDAFDAIRNHENMSDDFGKILPHWSGLGTQSNIFKAMKVSSSTDCKVPPSGSRAFLVKNRRLEDIDHKVILYVEDTRFILPDFDLLLAPRRLPTAEKELE